jgi:fumarate reductase flavoprotein subunit
LQIESNLQMPTEWELIETELEYTNWRTNSLLWRNLIDAAGEDVDWLSENGATFQSIDNYLGQSAYDTFHWWEGDNGAISGQALGESVINAGVDVRLSTPAVALIKDDNAVTGVYAKNDDTVLEVDAKAVLLSCGGLANNLELLAEKTEFNLDGAMSLFPINNVGDGLVMATNIGARETPVSLMNVFSATNQAPTDSMVVGTTLQPPAVFVNNQGERFMPEDLYIKKFFALVTNAWESQSGAYCIVNSSLIDKLETEGCYCGVAAVKAGDKLEGMRDQLDQAAETTDSGVYKGETVEELAEAMGIDATTLVDTINRYNEMCQAGKDEDYGKDAQYLLSFDEGPYYAVHPILCIFATMGGIDVDRQMRVLDTDGNPISGLYSSGSASCMLYKETYCYQVSGGMNAYCCYSGREAARQVAATVNE